MDRTTLTARDAAKYIGISYWLLLELVKRQEIPSIKVGSRKLFRQATLNEFLGQKEMESMGNRVNYEKGGLKKFKG